MLPLRVGQSIETEINSLGMEKLKNGRQTDTKARVSRPAIKIQQIEPNMT